MSSSEPASPDVQPLPDGDYAIVELLGHRTLIGRIAEVERFGTTMLCIEPVFCGQLLPAVYHGGASIYGVTPCGKEIAARRGPSSLWQLPAAIRESVPQQLLAADESAASVADGPSDDDDDSDDDWLANDDDDGHDEPRLRPRGERG